MYSYIRNSKSQNLKISKSQNLRISESQNLRNSETLVYSWTKKRRRLTPFILFYSFKNTDF